MLAVQLDTDAELYYRWRDHLMQVLGDSALNSENRREFNRLIREWNGKTDVDQAGFTLIRA
jgi:penicillin amidase